MPPRPRLRLPLLVRKMLKLQLKPKHKPIKLQMMPNRSKMLTKRRQHVKRPQRTRRILRKLRRSKKKKRRPPKRR